MTVKKHNKTARAKGNRAEALLLDLLTQKGYEVRRTHLSAFPDIIAWNEYLILMIEVKSRSASSGKHGISDALSSFKRGIRAMRSISRRVSIFCYILVGDEWLAYVWLDENKHGVPGGGVKQVTPIPYRTEV
jgi:hypothetical protein